MTAKKLDVMAHACNLFLTLDGRAQLKYKGHPLWPPTPRISKQFEHSKFKMC